MRIPMTWAIARAEMRSLRRLTRYWVFSVLAILVAFAGYMQYAVIHGLASSLSATVGLVGPRYLVSALGLYVLLIFLVGLVFLAFDVRARDVRERMAEVLDTRPISNLEFVFGRGLGLVLMALAPVLVLGLILQTFGSLAILFEWPFGEPVEPYSLLGLVFDATAIFLVWSSVIVLLAVLINNRLVVAVLSLTFIGLQVWGIFQAPVYLQTSVGFISSLFSASDILPAITSMEVFVQRMGLITLAIGLFFIAAAAHPCLDSNRRSRTLVGTGMLAGGALIIGNLVVVGQNTVDTQAGWLDAHESRSNEPRLDIHRITGGVTIDPANSGLNLTLELQVTAPPERSTDSMLFTLNPGLTVERVAVDGEELDVSHSEGLLEIPHPLAAGADATVEMTVSGVPDSSFGYLDSAMNFLTGTTMDAQIALLGFEVSVYDRRYVALTPGSHWLPKAGTAVPSADTSTHPHDYFLLDLEVSVPEAWSVAGPGTKTEVSEHTYRFHPQAPVPMVGLLAAEFERHSIKVSGVEFELLTYPDHQRNLKFFTDSIGELEAYLEELLSVDRYGLSYPYGAISLVEVPGNLRGYGGGWRMDSTQSMPGIVTMRESSFPRARFERAFADSEDIEADEGGLPRAKVEAIATFFENDVSGGNVFQGASRNFFLYQTSARGPGALALNFMLDELVTRFVTGSASYFSPYIFKQSGGSAVGETITNMLSGQSESVIESIRDSTTNRPSVWDMALGTPLIELDPDLDPRTALNVLALKSDATVSSILRGVDRENVGAMLSLLLERYRGRTFTVDEFNQTALEAGVDLQPLIGNWLTDAALPGFLTSAVRASRLEDDERGNPRYQTRFHLRNDEPTPGLVYFSYKIEGANTNKSSKQLERVDQVAPMRVAGHSSVEVGLLSEAPLTELTMHPFLSLNRAPVQLKLPRYDKTERQQNESFLGSRTSDWIARQSDTIYVDDLDDSFSIVSASPPPEAVAAGVFNTPVDLDQGLPEYKAIFGVPAVWSRQQNPTSWGKYRHTAAFVRAGQGTEQATFAATIPASGRWRLSLHIPNLAGQEINVQTDGVSVQASSGLRLGSYDLSLVNNGDTESLEFDGEAAETGWNPLGDFELSAGEASVRLTDKTTGSAVVADAIRWEPI